MAGSKLATMLTRNMRKIPVVLAYAFLEWVLIILIFSNSFFTYLIRKFAAYFGLKPPCPYCSRLDHLLEGSTSRTDPYEALVCENHDSKMSKLNHCSNQQRSALSETLLEEKCLSSEQHKHSQETQRCCFPFKRSPVIDDIEVEYDEGRGCKGNLGDIHSVLGCEHQVLSDVGSFYIRKVAEEDSIEEEEARKYYVEQDREWQESEERMEILGIEQNTEATFEGGCQIANASKEEKPVPAERRDHLLLSADNNETRSELEPDPSLIIQGLRSELDAERSAATTAANHTMAMITRLQEEKAAIQMEALQYQRMMEEQAEYDQQALLLMNELVAKREREKQELVKELDVYQERLLEYETKDKAIMMVQRCSNINSNSDSDVISIDLDGKKEISLLECVKEWGEIEGSLEELEEERLSIIKQLKELEVRLYRDYGEEEDEPNAELCSQEVNLVSSCFSSGGAGAITEDRPKTMASAALKLLDIVELADVDIQDKRETGITRMVAMQREMDHVYGRLQALEADAEFLRHCVGSLSKGNEGPILLQNILQAYNMIED